MIATIEKGTAYGRVEEPPSKNVSHRYLICGALSFGSVIENVAFSEDIKATLNCLSALGAQIEIDGSTVKTIKLLSAQSFSAMNRAAR